MLNIYAFTTSQGGRFMASRGFFAALGLIVFVNISAAGFTIKPDSGVVLVWEHGKATWTAVKDSAPIFAGDSIYLEDQFHAKLTLGNGCVVLLRGELRANIAGTDSAPLIHLDAGQLFLKRDPGSTLLNVKTVLRGCQFVPLGTAASFKFTKQGEPTVAVLSGKIRIEPPKGEPTTVAPGEFSTWDPVAGSFKAGKLPPEAIAALENWSGAKLSLTPERAGTDSVKHFSSDTSHKAIQASSSTQAAPAKAAAAQPLAAAPAHTGATKPASMGAQGSSSPAPQVVAKSDATTTQPAAISAAQTPLTSGTQQEKPAQPAQQEKKADQKAPANGTPGISWEVSASSVTVGNEQWTRMAVSPDIPIWKFGIGLDVELFLDSKGTVSNKAWNFDHNDWAESVLRKIKYLRFGYENDPVFVKVGGLSSVTLGYGFIVDRFTNMLHYPDEKLLGVQFNLNDISPVGITLQTLAPDVLEFKNNGGIAAARLALCPLKPANIPIVSNVSIGATYAVDLNEYSGARSWASTGSPRDRNNNGVYDVAYLRSKYPAAVVDSLIAGGDADTSKFTIDTTYRDSISRYALFCADVGIPIIKTDFLGLDVYGQAAVVADTAAFKQDRTGWGFGAPGVALRAGPVNASVEYRHVKGRFIPDYFDAYYYDERLQRYPVVETKSQSVENSDLNGVYGQLGFNIVNAVSISGSYQYLAGKDNRKDQRLELSGGLGDALLKRIPKITKAEVYLDKRNIGSTVMGIDSTGVVRYDGFFDPTPSYYYGYRIGVAITQGASLILDTRFGYQWDANDRLVPDNNVSIKTAITF
jgi:hypothetical protein